MIGYIAIGVAAVIGVLSVQNWWQGQRIKGLQADVVQAEAKVDEYRTSLDAMTKAADEQNRGIAALAEQTYAQAQAARAAIAKGKKRSEELELRIASMMSEKQPDKDPCAAACILLRSPL